MLDIKVSPNPLDPEFTISRVALVILVLRSFAPALSNHSTFISNSLLANKRSQPCTPQVHFSGCQYGLEDLSSPSKLRYFVLNLSHLVSFFIFLIAHAKGSLGSEYKASTEHHIFRGYCLA